MAALLALLLAGALALAAPRLHLQARVGEDLRSVAGEVRLERPEGVHLQALLPLLPVPTRDDLIRRTFPGRVEEGLQRLLPLPPDASAERALFTTVLPRRADASGVVPGRGLFVNGLWHPQPTRGAELAVVEWEVDLWIPEGCAAVLNGAVLEAEAEDRWLRWAGPADHLALAVLPRGRVERLESARGRLLLVDAGPRRPRRDEALRQAMEALPPEPGLDLVVVEAPLWRRLSRAGPRTLYLSDQAFRLTGPLRAFHRPAVQRGLLRAGLPVADSDLRELSADALAPEGGPDARALLGGLSWIPQIDELLYDGTLPYYSEVFDEHWPGDPVHDDIGELSGRRAPGRVVAHRLDHRLGEGSAAALARGLIAGEPLEVALRPLGLDPEGFEELRRLSGPQDLRVDMERGAGQQGARQQGARQQGARQQGARQQGARERGAQGRRARIRRLAEPSAPAEPILIRVDQTEHAWLAGPGPDELVLDLPERPRAIVLDPHGDVDQSPLFDRWPRRMTVVASFFPSELNLSDGRFSASADLALRRQYDTRWLFVGGLETNPRDRLRLDLRLLHFRGPLQDRRNRPLRLWASAGPALLDPAWRTTEAGRVALDAGLGAAWETRVDTDMPARGYRLSLSADGGVVPGSGQTWGQLGGGINGLLPLDGRWVLAARLAAGLAEGEVEHRLLALGGSGGVRGLPSSALLGQRAVVGNLELRWNLLRQVSVPLPLAWLSQLQLTGGLDAGQMALPEARALGLALGLGGKADLLGARPTYAGMVLGLPLEVPEGLEGSGPQLLLRLDRNF